MQIKKKISTGDAKYPLRIKMDTGLTLKIPQQKQFGTFCSEHGCSVTAVAIALQMLGINKSPLEVYNYCRRNISGHTGSKLTIFGCKRAINKISGKSVATWYPITGTQTNKDKAVTRIRNAVKAGKMVLIEQGSPIHTNIIIAKRSGGVWIATNGTVKKTTITSLVNGALKGVSGTENQDKWYKSGRPAHAAGYVIVKGS